MSDPVAQAPAQSENSTPAAEDFNSALVMIADYSAKGTAAMARHNYKEAVDCFANAAEVQARIRGDMDPENADILYLYGQALFKVGQSKSDVLGGTASGGAKKGGGSGAKTVKSVASKAEAKTKQEKVVEEGVAIVADEKKNEAVKHGDKAEKGANQKGDSAKENGKTENGTNPSKPLFQFTGDENFEDSDDEKNAKAEDDEEEEEEEDELASAFEILDLARVLFEKKLGEFKVKEGEQEMVFGQNSMVDHVKETLGDVHDLLGEILLESEKFFAALQDFRANLKYKYYHLPEASRSIAEAHFKVSLALEFASIIRSNDSEEGHDKKAEDGSGAQIDQAMRDDSIHEMETAVGIMRAKVAELESEVAEKLAEGGDAEIAQNELDECKEILADMEVRLKDLKAPPIDVTAMAREAAKAAMGGVLGATLGESSAEASARLEEASKHANVLSGADFIRRKAKADSDVDAVKAEAVVDAPEAENYGSKRKAEDDGAEEDSAKKAKVEASEKA